MADFPGCSMLTTNDIAATPKRRGIWRGTARNAQEASAFGSIILQDQPAPTC